MFMIIEEENTWFDLDIILENLPFNSISEYGSEPKDISLEMNLKDLKFDKNLAMIDVTLHDQTLSKANIEWVNKEYISIDKLEID